MKYGSLLLTAAMTALLSATQAPFAQDSKMRNGSPDETNPPRDKQTAKEKKRSIRASPPSATMSAPTGDSERSPARASGSSAPGKDEGSDGSVAGDPVGGVAGHR